MTQSEIRQDKYQLVLSPQCRSQLETLALEYGYQWGERGNVKQFVEAIAGGEVCLIPLTERKQLPAISAIYFCLSSDGQILYIGQTKNLQKRWENHHRFEQLEEIDQLKDQGTVDIAWLPCPEDYLLSVEFHLIEILKPLLNKQKISHSSTEDKNTAIRETIARNLSRYRISLKHSQEQLAEIVGISRQSINSYENAKTLPDSKSLSALARALGVTIDDLLRQPRERLPNFRFRTHAAFDCKPQFAAQVLRVLEDYTALEQAVGLPPYSPENTPCHQLEGNEKRIQTIAAQFRRRLGLGDAPILNLFAAVEEIGLKVIRQPIAIENFFGLSACSIEQGAFVLVNSDNITIERQLFTLAHEIGHLIFHRGEYQETLVEEGTKEEEKAREKVADYFAGYLLIPQDEFERTYKLTKDIIKLKRHFRVSYLAILKRLAEMGEIDFSKEKAKICAIYKSKYGSSLKNSMELPPTLEAEEFPENERYVYLIWQALKMGKISELKAAELLNLTVEELRVHRQENEVYAIA